MLEEKRAGETGFFSPHATDCHRGETGSATLTSAETEKPGFLLQGEEKRAGETGFFRHDPAGYHEGDIAAKDVASDETEKPGFLLQGRGEAGRRNRVFPP
jgi:hypothetical protein